MKTKTDFDFETFVRKLKRSFLGFEFEEGGDPNDSENPPFFSITKDGFGCCNLYDPNYNPPCQKPDCIVVILFNDRQANMSLDGLLVVPINVFDDIEFVDRIRQLLRFTINTTDRVKEQQNVLMLLSVILCIEDAVQQSDSMQLDVHLMQTKAVLNRKELISYFS